MKTILLFLIVFISVHTKAQFLSSSIKITGDIKSPKSLTIDSILKAKSIILKDIAITNQRGELKYTIKEAKGVPLLSFLRSVECAVERPKELNNYLLTFKSVDKAAVIFSWNELFNNPLGEKTFILFELDGKSILDSQGGQFILYSQTDTYSGRRYLKWLSEINYHKVNEN
ncbi:MAG: hypothetical protein H7Y07_14425 [Pyrinomonadaceae bacterium]|nr:hypothetical protein [Sphingobacteriaceae bacterium]